MCDLGGMQGSVGSWRALAHDIHIPGAIILPGSADKYLFENIERMRGAGC